MRHLVVVNDRGQLEAEGGDGAQDGGLGSEGGGGDEESLDANPPWDYGTAWTQLSGPAIIIVKPPMKDTLKKDKPLYKGH